MPYIADWPYRFAFWASVSPANTQVWLDANGRVLGWVVLQTPFWTIDCQVNSHVAECV